MQPIKQLAEVLGDLADREHYLFSLHDLEAVMPQLSAEAVNAVLGRATKNNLLKRVCRRLYLYPKVNYPAGLVLYHAAARLRANEFNYISLESALSAAGVISQIPMNWITIMSTGRTYTVDCGEFGHIEFIHTKKKLNYLAMQVNYDPDCHLWRASVSQALQDMESTRRSTDLVDWEVVREFI
jgi:predicted transcriptional regulator of viral defense system